MRFQWTFDIRKTIRAWNLNVGYAEKHGLIKRIALTYWILVIKQIDPGDGKIYGDARRVFGLSYLFNPLKR